MVFSVVDGYLSKIVVITTNSLLPLTLVITNPLTWVRPGLGRQELKTVCL